MRALHLQLYGRYGGVWNHCYCWQEIDTENLIEKQNIKKTEQLET